MGLPLVMITTIFFLATAIFFTMVTPHLAEAFQRRPFWSGLVFLLALALLIPIAGIFVIDPVRGASTSERLSSSSAFRQLLENGYALKFGDGALAGTHGSRLFQTCARLAREVPVSRLRPPDGFERLRTFASSIIHA